MSSLTGEASLRDGIAYEFLWVAHCLVDLLEEKAESIEFAGKPGEEGVDIRMTYPDRIECHQVKRMKSSDANWTIASIKPVLQHFGVQLADPRVRCHFVSKIGVPDIEILATPAKRNTSVEEFFAGFPDGESGPCGKLLHKLSAIWAVSLPQSWEYVGRIYCRTPQEEDLRQSCRRAWEYLVTNAEAALSMIPDLALQRFHSPLRAADIWSWLAGKGVVRRPFEADPRIFDRISAQTDRFLAACRRDVFIEPPLPRLTAENVISSIIGAECSTNVAVLGLPGGGKSVALHQVVERLRADGFPVLAFQLHDFPEQCSPKQFQEQIDFHLDPVAALSKVAGEKPPVLVIDQLDSISIYSGRGGGLLTRVEELIDAVRHRRSWMKFHLILSCRAVDWKHDHRLRRLHIPEDSRPDPASIVVEVPSLTDAEIDSVLQAKGLRPALFTKRQRDELLRVPQNLRLLVATRPDDVSNIRTSVDLQRLFEAHIRRNTPRGSEDLWPSVTRTLTERLAGSTTRLEAQDPQQGCLAAPASTLSQFSRPYLDYLQYQGVLYQVDETKPWRFAHETLFDYCFAQQFIAAGQSLVQWLENSDQTLRQRTQVRQVLTMLREDDRGKFLREVQALLASANVCPHIKSNVAAFLGSLPEVDVDEWGIMEPRIRRHLTGSTEGEKDWISEKLFGEFYASDSCFRYILNAGILERWLGSDGEYQTAWSMMVRRQPNFQHEVWPLIHSRLGDERFSSLIEESFLWLKADASRETFEWLAGRLVDDHFAEIETSEKVLRSSSQRHYLHSLFANLKPHRVDWLFEAVNLLITRRLMTWKEDSFIFFGSHEIPESELREAINQNPAGFLEIVMPCLLAAIEETGKAELSPWHGFHSWSYGSDTARDDDETCSMEDGGLAFGALTALKLCMDGDALIARRWITILGRSPAVGARRIGGAALKYAPPDFAGDAWEFLMAHPDTLDLDGFPHGEEIAEVILRRFASVWSRQQVDAVEQVVLRFIPPGDLEPLYGDDPLSRRNQAWRRRRRRGRIQLRLLPLLPQDWLASESKQLLAELKRRAESLSRVEAERKATRPKELSPNATARWDGPRWIRAFQTAANRPMTPDWLHSPFTSRTDFLEAALRRTADESPTVALRWLLNGGDGLPWSFAGTILNSIQFRIRDTGSLVKAAQWMFRQNDEKHGGYVWELLLEIAEGPVPDAALEMIMEMLSRPPCAQDGEFRLEAEKRLEEYELKADATAQGKALKALAHLMQRDTGITGRLGLPCLLQLLENATTFTLWGWLRVVLSIACSEGDRGHSFTLFTAIAHHSSCDDYLLCSPASMRFISIGVKERLEFFRPFIMRMMTSNSEIVRSKGAELATIAGLHHLSARGMMDMAVNAECEPMRKAAAAVAGKALKHEPVSATAQSILLALRDDRSCEVRKKVGWSLRQLQRLDLRPFQAFIRQMMTSASFPSSVQHLASALEHCPAKLPELAFDFIESFLRCVIDGSDSGPNDRALWAHSSVREILMHLYYENPEIEVRRRALTLINKMSAANLLSEKELEGV